jgi:hypothetical protein
MALSSIASLVESRGFSVRTIAASDGQEWLSVSVDDGVDLTDLARALPNHAAAIRSAVDGIVLVALPPLVN